MVTSRVGSGHETTNNPTQATVSFTKAASRLFLRTAISKQLYAVPYLVVCVWLLLWEEPVPTVHGAGELAISLTPRPMTVVFGLRTRLSAHMRTKVEHPSQQVVSSPDPTSVWVGSGDETNG